MSNFEDLIDFNVIEGQKENIQSIPSGRSARSLANMFTASPLQPLATPTPSDTNNLNNAARQEFEQELELIAESDDPLDIFDRYVKWTMDAYPSAQATPQSQLLPLLERATKTFLNSAQYKNDPRYLKLWLTYIRLFSDTPRETFAFLSRHNVGEGLALFYEEFAFFLEGAGRWTQAEEIYNLGIEREARPAPRLLRKYNEFQQRYAAQPEESHAPASPALPTVRPALAAKINPFATAAAPAPVDPQAPRPSSGIGGGTSKNGKQKLAIFSDADAVPSAVSGAGTMGWESIGSLAERRKENVIEPKPWAGETLKAGGKKSSTKMAVFKDTSAASIPVSNTQVLPSKEQVTVNPRNGKSERIFVNLEACYPMPQVEGSELCFEELRAASRGWLNMVWEPESNDESVKQESSEFDDAFVGVGEGVDEPVVVPKKKEKLAILKDAILTDENVGDSLPPKKEKMAILKDPVTAENKKPVVLSHKLGKLAIHQDLMMTDENSPAGLPRKVEKLVIPKDLVMLDENGAVIQPREGKGRRIKRIEVNETQIIKANLSSPSGNKKVKRKATAEPTMTFHTKAATDDIYELFNQPLKSETQEEEEDDEESETDDDDDETDGDYTTDGESTGTGKQLTTSEAGDDETSEVKSVSEWSDFTARKHIPKIDDDDDDDDNDENDDDTQDSAFSEVSAADLVGAVDGLKMEDSRPDEEDEESQELVTPVSPEPPKTAVRTMFVPIPPEDYVAPTRPYRDASQVSQNRLPFMTPIAEKTESSLGAFTSRAEKDEFISKTPSKENGARISAFRGHDNLYSSPFQEITNEALPRPKIVQPALGVSAKSKAVSAPKSQSGSFVKEFPPKGPLIKDAQCNPVDDYTRNMIFEALQPPLSSYEGYFDHSKEASGRTSELKKFAKAVAKMSKNSSDKTTTNITMPPVLKFPGTDRQYMVKRELGAGAFAPVYLIENVADDTEEISGDDDDKPKAIMGKGTFSHFNRERLEALKMEDPPTAWEFYIMRQAARRLGVSRAADSIVTAYEFHHFEDECYLIEQFRDQGTLLDLVNIARADSTAAGGVMDECLSMFFAIELFRTAEALHSKGLLHGDLKADNCLVRFDALPSDAVWTSRYRRDGSGGWNAKGVALIDFGRGIDMKVFRPDVQFIADWKTSAADCAEMRELRPWTYQIDYHGLAGIVHSMLFGKYIDTVADNSQKLGGGATKTWRIRENLKRYWQTEIWGAVFDLLLNPGMHTEGEEGGKLPVLKGMRKVRESMEAWVEENCERGAGLQSQIRKLEAVIAEKGRRR